MTIQDMNIIPPHQWPKGAEPDNNLYSLETSRSAELVWDTETGTFSERFAEPDMTVKPDFAPETGTYHEIGRRAAKMNKAQQQSGFVAWIFHPALIEPLGAR